ncbi:MAG: CZB domain-containing protein [Acidobacteriales bacterium]|nr:CZB domain-containing protein [Terriglobales bacterium]
MGRANFAMAKLKHQAWKLRLRAFVEGREDIKESEAVSPRDCDLGKWLYGEGLSTYKNYPEMQKLESEHMQMHNVVKQIVTLQHSGKVAEAMKLMPPVNEYSDHVVGLLTTMEGKIK